MAFRQVYRRALRALLLTVAAAGAASPLGGQQATRPRGTMLGAGGTFTTATGATGAIAGPRIDLVLLRPGGVGPDFGLAYLPPSRVAEVFPSYQAVLGDVGAAYSFPLVSDLLLFRAGGSFLLNADGQGDIGPYVGIGIVHSLTGRLALRAGASGRYWIDGPGFGAGADLGLVLLPKPHMRASQPSRSRGEPRRINGWAVGAAGSLHAASYGNDGLAFWGPSFVASRITPRGIGFESGMTYLVPSGSYGFTGLALDLGMTYGIPLGPGTVVLLRGGASAIAGGDSDGSQGAAVGLYPGIGLVRRLAGPLGLRLDVTPRFWLGQASPATVGAAVGLVLLP